MSEVGVVWWALRRVSVLHNAVSSISWTQLIHAVKLRNHCQGFIPSARRQPSCQQKAVNQAALSTGVNLQGFARDKLLKLTAIKEKLSPARQTRWEAATAAARAGSVRASSGRSCGSSGSSSSRGRSASSSRGSTSSCCRSGRASRPSRTCATPS